MSRYDLKAVPVVGEKREVLGMVTDRDLLRHLLPQLLQQGAPESAGAPAPSVREIMSRSVMCVSEDQGVSDVASIMINKDVERVPVVNEGKLVGFLTRGDIIRKLLWAVTRVPVASNLPETKRVGNRPLATSFRNLNTDQPNRTTMATTRTLAILKPDAVANRLHREDPRPPAKMPASASSGCACCGSPPSGPASSTPCTASAPSTASSSSS